MCGGVTLCLILSVFSLLASFSLVSCGATSAKTSGTSGLCVRVPKTSSQSRAAQYNVSDLEVFTVIVDSGRFSTSKSCGQGETLEFTDLSVGRYNVTAIAKKSDGTVTGRGSASVDIEADVVKNVTIVIHRLNHYTIQVYDAVGTTSASVEVSDGEKLPKPATPPSPGTDYEFGGWFVGSSTATGVTYSSAAYNFDAPVTSGFSLYAKWVYKTATFTGSLSSFINTTFKANTKATPYNIQLTGLSNTDLAAVAAQVASKGVYINLDLSSCTGINHTGNNTFDASSNESLAGLATYLTGISLPPNAKIGNWAFKGCSNLSGTISIPAGCICIGRQAFKDTGISGYTDGGGARIWQRVDAGANSWVGGWECYLVESHVLDGINADGNYYYAPSGSY